MYRIRLHLVAAAFLVTAVSGNLTSASFGRRRGILPSCIVGSSRVSHRRHRQMRSGTPIALGGSSLSIRYPPSSVGLSSLATAVYLRVGSIDADSSSFELGRSQNYVSNSAAREALGMRGGATVAEGINNTHVEKDQGWMWWYVFFRCAVPIRNLTLLDLVFRFNGPAVPRSTENNVSNSAALAMRGGATMTEVDRNSKAYLFGRMLGKMLIFFLGYYVGQHTKSKQTPIDHGYQYRRQPDYATTNSL